jgi:methionine-rich copper-binding protein CopC
MTSARGFRRLAILAVAVSALFLLPAFVSAHAELVRAIPADGATATEPVTFVSGRYSEDLAADSNLRILDAAGATVGTGGVDPNDDRVMIARPDAPLTSGTFTVQSTTISAVDGYPDRATWSFTVDVPATPSPTAAPTGSAPPPSSEPTSTPTPAPTAAPTPSPPPADQTASTADLAVPIVAALALVTIGAGFLLRRGRRP